MAEVSTCDSDECRQCAEAPICQCVYGCCVGTCYCIDKCEECYKCCCFPADALVELDDGKRVKMRNLRLNDKVMVVNKNNTKGFSQVLAFAHENPSDVVPYHKISGMLITSGGDVQGFECFASAKHFVRTRKKGNSTWRYARAETVAAADEVLVSEAWVDGDHDNEKFATATVTAVAVRLAIGLFCPLTATGTIVVDGMAASCYAVGPSHEIAHFIAKGVLSNKAAIEKHVLGLVSHKASMSIMS